MMGQSKIALSSVGCRPLSGFLEARPTCIVGLSLLRTNFRCLADPLASVGHMVITTERTGSVDAVRLDVWA